MRDLCKHDEKPGHNAKCSGFPSQSLAAGVFYYIYYM